MPRFLIVLEPGGSTIAADLRRDIRARGGRVLHSYGPAVLVIEGEAHLAGSLAEHRGVLQVHSGPAPAAPDLPGLDETGRTGIAAWNATLSPSFREAKKARPGDGLSWDADETDNDD